MRPMLVSGLLAAAAMLTAVALGVAVALLLTAGSSDGSSGHGAASTMAATLPEAARVVDAVRAMPRAGRIRGAGIRSGGAR